MRRTIPAGALAVLLLSAALLLAACTDDTDGPTAEDDDCPAELAEPLAAWGASGFSGVVVVTTAGEADCTVATAGHGPDTVFGIGSVSKAFTAAAVLDLVDAGTIALDDRAGDLVPGLDGPVAGVTVEQLLLHTSGLIGSHGLDSEPLEHDAAVAAISRLTLAFEPGTDFLYSNTGYTLLALIVEAVAPGGHRGYLTEEVLALPDGSTAGTFGEGDPSATGDHWAVAGNGDLAMTVPELAAWTHALFTGDIVGHGALERITTPGFDMGDGTGETAGWVAFDDSRFGTPFLGVAGGGGDTAENAVVVWLPEAERVIAVASDSEEVTAEDLLLAIGPALATGDVPPRPEARGTEVDRAELEAAAGRYDIDAGGSGGSDTGDSGGFEVSVVDGDRLAVAASGPTAVAALFPRPGGVSAAEVAEHEAAVIALLAGETAVGRDELDLLEEDLGPVDDVVLTGTIVADRELRTYVLLTAGGEEHGAWYSVDEHGEISAVELTDELPTLVLVPIGDGRFVPDDPTGAGADLTVEFRGDELAVGDVTATRRRTG